jgi:hypothetical protein
VFAGFWKEAAAKGIILTIMVILPLLLSLEAKLLLLLIHWSTMTGVTIALPVRRTLPTKKPVRKVT